MFLLREVLAYSALEVADILDMSVPAVKSARQRARAKLDDIAPNAELLSEPDSPESRSILDRYMSAFERVDIAALAELLRRDATLEVRMYSTIANGRPAAVTCRREDIRQPFTPFGLAVLTTDTRHTIAITTIIDPAVVEQFGFPPTPDQPSDHPPTEPTRPVA
jgi:RNA polymerase sigma-70 factor (ECF subfamily)